MTNPSYGPMYKFVRSYLFHLMSNLLQIRKMTFLYDKHYMQGTIVAMAAKMPEVILAEYGLLNYSRNRVSA